MSADIVYDFHTHTFLGDGVLLPIELIRRCIASGYGAMAIAEHASPATMKRVIDECSRDCRAARQQWDFEAYPAIELTHVPPDMIADLAGQAKQQGAALVVVHGETPVEPVPDGTNIAAASCPDVDILAHPGLISSEAARTAADNDVFIEVTARRGHSLANGHVVAVAVDTKANLVVNSDAHAPDDILTAKHARKVARGAGIGEEMMETVLIDNPLKLRDRARANL